MFFPNKILRTIIILCANILFFIFCAKVLPICFETNDDVAMCMIANGTYTGIPDNHLVYINAIYGSLLNFFYSILPSVEWYTILFATIHIISMTIIVYIMSLNIKNNKILIGAIITLIYVLWIRLLVSFQFTTTSGLACVAGCALLMMKKRKFYILGVVMIIFASLIRFNLACFVLFLFSPVFVFNIQKKKKQYIFLFLLALLILGLHSADKYFYKGEEWKKFVEYNNERGRINDDPNEMLDDNKLPEGISANDYELFKNFFGDPEVIKIDELKKISSQIMSVDITQKFKNFTNIKYYRKMLALLMLLALSCVCMSPNNIKGYLCIAVYFFFVLVLGSVCLIGILKNRVFLCAFLTFIVVFFYLIPDIDKNMFQNRVYISYLGLAIVCMMAVYYSKQIVDTKNINEELINNYHSALTLVNENISQKKDHILPIKADFPIEGVNPWKVRFNFFFIFSGWLTNYPSHVNFYSSHMDIVRQHHMVFVSNDNINMIKKIQQGLVDNYGIKTNIILKAQNSKYCIVQFMEIYDSEAIDGGNKQL